MDWSHLCAAEHFLGIAFFCLSSLESGMLYRCMIYLVNSESGAYKSKKWAWQYSWQAVAVTVAVVSGAVCGVLVPLGR